MTTILEAKRHLQNLVRREDGFVGVGVGRRNNQDVLRVYVVDSQSPAARRFSQTRQFEGFPVEVQVSGRVQALGS
jgi:hypothetical protein